MCYVLSVRCYEEIHATSAVVVVNIVVVQVPWAVHIEWVGIGAVKVVGGSHEYSISQYILKYNIYPFCKQIVSYFIYFNKWILIFCEKIKNINVVLV